MSSGPFKSGAMIAIPSFAAASVNAKTVVVPNNPSHVGAGARLAKNSNVIAIRDDCHSDDEPHLDGLPFTVPALLKGNHAS